MSKLELIYSGSVKDIYQSQTNGHLYFEFSDRYSVFDWGEMPDLIQGKGEALAYMGKYFFDYLGDKKTFKSLAKPKSLDNVSWQELTKTEACKKLASSGMTSHFFSHEKNRLEVLPVKVLRPKSEVKAGKKTWHYEYNKQTTNALIPLEVIFRFGMPSGSSLKKRLEKIDLAQIGLNEIPVENHFFDNVIVEFSTKLEPEDRYLSYDEAQNIASLSDQEFLDLITKTKLLAVALENFFQKMQLDLWDGKFEFALDAERQIILVDSIGIDELRLTYKTKHLSKEFLRQYYRDSDWYKACEEAKKIAANNPHIDWKSYCVKELKQSPKKLDQKYYKKVTDLYSSFVNKMAKVLNQQEPFKQATDFDLFLTNF